MTVQQIPTQDLPEAVRGKLAAADAALGDGEADFAAVLEATIVAGEISAELARPYVSRLWFTPWQVAVDERVREREAGWLVPTSPVRIDAGGQRLAGYEAGAGPVVLLVHGWGDHAARLGTFVEPLLARGLGVVAVDMPGHGGSRGSGPADLYRWADALRDIVRARQVQGVVAHSVGAVALAMALRDLPDLRGAAMLAPGVSLRTALDLFVAVFDLPQGAVDALGTEIDERFGRDVWRDADATVHVRTAGVPSLVVWSADDSQVPTREMQALADAWPGSRTLVVDGLGHSRVLRDAQVVAPVVEFLAAQLEPRTAP